MYKLYGTYPTMSSLPSTPIKRLPSLEAPCTQLLQWHMYQLYGTYPTTTPVCTPLCPGTGLSILCCSVLLLVVLCWLLLLPIRSIGCLPSVKQSKRSTPRASGLYRWEHSNSTLSKFQLTTKLICMSSSKWRLVALLAVWSCTPTPVSLLCPINTSTPTSYPSLPSTCSTSTTLDCTTIPTSTTPSRISSFYPVCFTFCQLGCPPLVGQSVRSLPQVVDTRGGNSSFYYLTIYRH